MAEEREVSEQQVPTKKNKTLLFVIIIVVVLMMVIMAVVAIVMLSGDDEEPRGKVPTHQTTPLQENTTNGVSTNRTNHISVGPLYPISPPFIVNLVTQSGRRYLKASITLELSTDKLKNEIAVKSAIVQDTINEILSSKSIEEIVTSKGKERLKGEIVNRINEFLADGKIESVFFTEFVIQ